MTKHYIADGKYGAELEREYEEVAENAGVGDYVTRDGIIRKVKDFDYGTNSVEFSSYMEYDEEEGEDVEVIGWGDGSYKTLRPTQPEVVRYGGLRYALAERKAEVGELVVDKSDGEIYDVLSIQYLTGDDERSGIVIDHDGMWIGDANEYLVLKPLKPTLESLIDGIKGGNPHVEQSPKSTEALIANLARRVSQLESKVDEKQYAIYELESKLSGLESDYEDSDTQTEKWADAVNGQLRNLQRNLETFAQETTSTRLLAKDAKELAQANEKDIVTLDERTNTQSQPKETELMREIRQLLESFEGKDGE